MMNDYKQYLTKPIRKDRKPLHELLPLAKPLRVMIDPCDTCNFRCNFCFQSQYDFGKGSQMSIETFDRIMDQLGEFDGPINIIHLYGLGEPMINKNLPYFIRTIKDRNIAKEVAITSNGSLLSRDYSDKLIEAGLDRLSISLNGLSDDDFKRIVGVKVDFDKLYEEILYFYEHRNQCHLHVKINGECFSEEQRNYFVEQFKDCTDSINIDHVVNNWAGLEIINSSNNMYGLNKKNKSNICIDMLYELLIHPNGTVSPCCVDYKYQKQNLGSIFDSTIKDIWNSKFLHIMQMENLQGCIRSYEICKECQPGSYATVDISEYRDELMHKYERLVYR